MMSFGFLIDTTLCVGCEACMVACDERNKLSEEDESYELSVNNYTVVKNKTISDQDIYYRQMCMHCEDPTCVSVCPVAAFEKTPEGPVIYHGDRCMGCRYCIMACPFDVPKFEWNKALPLVRKCDMCYDRIKAGGIPACAEACPTEATLFGDRDELIEIARQRIRDNKDQYYPYIYGLEEAGGTSVLIISSVSLAELGFKMKNFQAAFPKLTWEVMKEIPNVVTFGGVFLYGLWWIINRRIKLQEIPANGDEIPEKEEK
ncbi:MAG: 4Fe-4S dicluster domain-containing protein [Calditrichaeota bacterium]|nr:4Fe-4S dicluster domain-containing protein [Calditrichota bacterium]RQW08172.1 MAG: 4Fe-4S dicluster domain-containing protein [Calditrichota bacterium]